MPDDDFNSITGDAGRFLWGIAMNKNLSGRNQLPKTETRTFESTSLGSADPTLRTQALAIRRAAIQALVAADAVLGYKTEVIRVEMNITNVD